MIKFILEVLPFLALIYREYLSASARAREEDKQFELNQATLRGLVQKAIEKMPAENVRDSKQAGNAWDAVDQAEKETKNAGS